jgi:hypothetical protein
MQVLVDIVLIFLFLRVMICNRERKTDPCKWSEENMLSAFKTFKVDRIPLTTATKTFAEPRNALRRQVLSKVEIPKFG